MNEEFFRQKSLNKIKSPENLDDYIQVSNPSVWLLLISVIILLAGACVWGVYANIDSSVETNIQVENGVITCSIEGDAVSSVHTGMIAMFDDFEAVITEVNRKDGKYVCVLESNQIIPDGFYDGQVITETYKPISFILN